MCGDVCTGTALRYASGKQPEMRPYVEGFKLHFRRSRKISLVGAAPECMRHGYSCLPLRFRPAVITPVDRNVSLWNGCKHADNDDETNRE